MAGARGSRLDDGQIWEKAVQRRLQAAFSIFQPLALESVDYLQRLARVLPFFGTQLAT